MAESKVTAEHLARDAYLYVRQSTLRQVVENGESTQRQYALRDRALAGTSFFAEGQVIDPSQLCLAGEALYWVRAGSMPSRAKACCWIGVGLA